MKENYLFMPETLFKNIAYIYFRNNNINISDILTKYGVKNGFWPINSDSMKEKDGST